MSVNPPFRNFRKHYVSEALAHPTKWSFKCEPPAELTSEEWADVIAAATTDRPMEKHLRLMNSIESGQRIEALLENAKRLTAEAVAKASGTAPTMTEARIFETATTHASKSEKKVQEEARSEAMDNYQEMLDAVLRSGSFAEIAS